MTEVGLIAKVERDVHRFAEAQPGLMTVEPSIRRSVDKPPCSGLEGFRQ